MTPDKYLERQEMNKKFYEVVKSSAEKNYWLAKMMEDEIKYLCANNEPIKIDGATSLGESLKCSSQNTEANRERDFIAFEKLSLDNFDSKITATNLSGNSVDLSQFPNEAKQKICDLFNQAQQAKMQQIFGKDLSIEKFEDSKYMGYKRSPVKIANPDLEVNEIIKRANTMHTKSSKISLPTEETQPMLEEQNVKPSM